MWFIRNKKGVDNKILRKTKYWNDLEMLIDTDTKTQEKIVQYIYEQVSNSIIDELNRIGSELDRMTLIPEARNYALQRVKMLENYREMVYGTEEKSS